MMVKSVVLFIPIHANESTRVCNRRALVVGVGVIRFYSIHMCLVLVRNVSNIRIIYTARRTGYRI